MCRKRIYVKRMAHIEGQSSTNLFISTTNSSLLCRGRVKSALQILVEMVGLAFEFLEDGLGRRLVSSERLYRGYGFKCRLKLTAEGSILSLEESVTDCILSA